MGDLCIYTGAYMYYASDGEHLVIGIIECAIRNHIAVCCSYLFTVYCDIMNFDC